MNLFVAIKFEQRHNKELMDGLEKVLKQGGYNPYFFVKNEGYSQHGRPDFTDMISNVVDKIRENDALLIECSQNGTGLGIEAGIAYMMGKPVYVVHRYGTRVSTTLRGLSRRVLEYKDINEIPGVFE
ncbi:hypothetical protein GF345_06235 [Candidatus Woesearchaeota archaeon]|nr:hypothetical protein [Candidatus Woesearchaeota archaeon]